MIIKLIFTSVTLLLITYAGTKAQSNYKSGYIVHANRDTARGFIDYKERELNSSEVYFKFASNDKDEIVYKAPNIVGYGIDGIESFELLNLSISKDEVSPTKLGDKPLDTGLLKVVVFAKVLMKGNNVNLYSYTDTIKTRFFISEADNTPLELGYHLSPYFGRELVSTTNYSYTTIDSYKGQLGALAQKYKVTSKGLLFRIEKAAYNERELRSIIGQINNNVSSFDSKTLFGYSIFVSGGINAGKFHLAGEGTFPAAITIKDIAPEFNAGIYLYNNKFTQKFYFKAGLNYNAHHYAYKDAVSYANSNVTSSLDFTQSNLALTGALGWNYFNKPHFKAFLDAGIGINLSAYNKYNYTENFYNSSSVVHPQYPEFAKAWPIVVLHSGFELSEKLIVYVGYSPPSKISGYPGLAATVSSYRAGVTYIFKKF